MLLLSTLWRMISAAFSISCEESKALYLLSEPNSGEYKGLLPFDITNKRVCENVKFNMFKVTSKN